MRNLLIIYNVIFLLAGNVLFSNIHHNHNHNHNHSHTDDYETHECQECINFENSSNYVQDFQKVSFSNNYTSLLVNEYSVFFRIDIQNIAHSRAPPIS
tara:strand:- start:42 stop:335 length:294 start_codon:yes stop_codon:yes gene_type:complete